MVRAAAISVSVALLALAPLASSATVAPGAAPALLTEAVAQTQAQKRAYAFDYEQVSSATVQASPPKTEQSQWRAHFDPAGAAPHLHLVDPPRLQGNAQSTFNAVAQHLDGVGWCASAEMAHAQNVQLAREDASAAVYLFQPSRDQIHGGGMAQQMAQRLRGEMTVLKGSPDISGIHIFLTQPFSPIPFTNVTTLDIAIHCETAPNGRRYAAQTITSIAGSAFGKNFTEQSTVHTSNLTGLP